MKRNPLNNRSVKLGVAALAAMSTLGLTAGIAAADDGTTEGPGIEMAAEFPSADFGIDEAWIAAEQATENELAAYLDEKSISYSRTNDGFVDRVTPTWSEDEAANQIAADAIDDFYWSKSPMSAEDIAGYNAEQQAFNDAMAAKGVATRLTSDRHGLTVVEITDYNDAAFAAIDDYYGIAAEEASE